MSDRSVTDQFLRDLDPPPDGKAAPATAQAPLAGLPRPFAGVASALWLLILVIACLVFIFFRFSGVETQRAVAYEMALAVRAVKGNLLDAETGQRGFVITGDASFLQPYRDGMARIESSLADLRIRLAGDPALRARLNHAATLWAKKAAEMDTTIEQTRQGRSAEASALIAGGTGKAWMEGIRDDLDAISANSARQVAAALIDFQFWSQWLTGFGVLALLLAVWAAVWEIARLKRFLGHSSDFQADIVATNQTLEQLIEDRTQSLGKISALLQAVMAATGEAIYAKDLQCRMMFANDSALRIIGLPRNEVIGKSVVEFHPDLQQAEAVMQNDRNVLASGVSQMMEEVYSTGSDRRVFMSNKQVLKNSRGEIIGLVGISTDITGRKATEAARFLSEQRFRAAVDAFDGIIWTTDSAGSVTWTNQAWTALTGQSVAEASGPGWSQCLHPDDIEPTRLHWTDCLTRLVPFMGEYRVRAVGGQYHTFAVRAVPVRDEGQNVIEWVGLNIDISAERQTQRLLQQTVERLDVALAAGNTGAWEMRADLPDEGVFDERMHDIWNLPPGSNLADFVARIHPEDRKTVEGARADVFRKGSDATFDLEYRILTVSKGLRWVAVKSKSMMGADRIKRIIGTARDISARKSNEERIGFLMRELTHRTKNSLAIVQAIARQTALRATSLDEFQASFQHRLHGMAESLNLVVQSNGQPVSLVDLVRSQTKHLCGQGNDRLVLSGPEVRLKAEAAQNIGLALHELSTNAAKYGAFSTAGGVVRIEWTSGTDASGLAIFSLLWTETGGPKVSPPEQTGFGHTVIHRVVKAALAGSSQLRFPPEGVIWALTIPASHIVLPGDDPVMALP